MASLAFAHGNQQHVMGTVATIGANTITVKTTAGKLTEVAINEKTKVSKAGQKVELKDIKVGDRVAIHATKHDNRLEATTVQLGGSGQSPAAAGHQH